jgi:hypothetical protein
MATSANLINYFNYINSVYADIERQYQFVEDFRRDNKVLAELYKNDISQELASRGWFIAGDLCCNQYKPLDKALKMKEENEIEDFLKEHVRNLVSNIKESAMKRWRERSQIIADAFDAHSSAKYTLSVPVLLAQADGISADILGAYLFSNNKGPIEKAASNAIKKHLKHRPLAKSFLGMLLNKLGIGIKTIKRDELAASGLIFSPLNRHGVLHGLDCDYATEANSLRGIALINFLEWVAGVIPTKENSQTSSST